MCRCCGSADSRVVVCWGRRACGYQAATSWGQRVRWAPWAWRAREQVARAPAPGLLDSRQGTCPDTWHTPRLALYYNRRRTGRGNRPKRPTARPPWIRAGATPTGTSWSPPGGWAVRGQRPHATPQHPASKQPLTSLRWRDPRRGGVWDRSATDPRIRRWWGPMHHGAYRTLSSLCSCVRGFPALESRSIGIKSTW